MELYDTVARQTARLLTLRYSTSFSLASRLFGAGIREDIYAIYGAVRIADEIVDTYRGRDAAVLLHRMETDIYDALDRGFATDLVIHAFAQTARRHGIGRQLIEPFFASMAMDLKPVAFDRAAYETYIYGSAEVVGLMCLRVFCAGDDNEYQRLETGARALGAAFQKVNFLRDLADDRGRLGRDYFPQLQTTELDEAAKRDIIDEISRDFAAARAAIVQLPPGARTAVTASYRYHEALLDKLRTTPAAIIRQRRIRISNGRKLWLLGSAAARRLRIPADRTEKPKEA